MFYLIENFDRLPDHSSFKKGLGLYLLRYLPQLSYQNDVWFYNSKQSIFTFLCYENDLPNEALEYFETEKMPKKQETKFNEDFVLKAMALAKCNTQTIKLSDILNSK
jgi:hypothetical protein